MLAHAEGFRVGELPVRHHPRRWGTSKYGWSRLIKGFLDLLTVTFLTEYRQRPMHVLGVPGVVALATGGLIGLWSSRRDLPARRSATARYCSSRCCSCSLAFSLFGLGLLGELLVHGEHVHESASRTTSVRNQWG